MLLLKCCFCEILRQEAGMCLFLVWSLLGQLHDRLASCVVFFIPLLRVCRFFLVFCRFFSPSRCEALTALMIDFREVTTRLVVYPSYEKSSLIRRSFSTRVWTLSMTMPVLAERMSTMPRYSARDANNPPLRKWTKRLWGMSRYAGVSTGTGDTLPLSTKNKIWTKWIQWISSRLRSFCFCFYFFEKNKYC